MHRLTHLSAKTIEAKRLFSDAHCRLAQKNVRYFDQSPISKGGLHVGFSVKDPTTCKFRFMRLAIGLCVDMSAL